MTAPLYADFLGTWILDPQSCDYQQGEPPRSGLYRIEERAGELEFTMTWVDAGGEKHEARFAGKPDGVPEPFSGGPLVDSLAVRAVSDRELNSHGYFAGDERMVAQRQLDQSRQAMRVTQLVRFDDGTRLANVAVYHKQILN